MSLLHLIFIFYALITLATSFLCPKSQGLADLVFIQQNSVTPLCVILVLGKLELL